MVPDTFRLTDDISIMKYICKEFWISLFTKQIDNLRTNNSVNIFEKLFYLYGCFHLKSKIKGYFCFTRQ
jgi:hypothetical protein